MARPRLPKSIAEAVHWYEHYISPIALVGGFISDNLFLTRRVDLWQTNALLGSYLIISACGLVLLNLLESGRVRTTLLLKFAPVVPIIIQFSLGGLLSGFLSLYSRSAGIATSWLFVFVIAALLLGNERFSRFYVRLPVQMGLYFFVLFSFLIFFLPVIFKVIGPVMFLISGAASLVILALFMGLMRHVVPEVVKRERIKVALTVAIIFVVINLLYFYSFLPPLPLSLKSAGVYHSATLEGSDFHLGAEVEPWYASLLSYDTTFHLAAGGTAYVFSSVFAPAGLSTTIVDQWQHYDDTSGTWITVASIPFPITGGRDAGYRGYTYDSSLTTGKWRVNILTGYGQLIGRVTFTVDDTPGNYPLTDVIR